MKTKRVKLIDKIIIFLFLCAISLPIIFFCVNDSKSEQVIFADFSGGLRNDVSADVIADNQTPDCKNVITNENGGSLKKRDGFTLFANLTSSQTYPCQGITLFREQNTGNEYFIVAHGLYLSKVDVSTNTDFSTTRTTTTLIYEDFSQNDAYVYGCNGYDNNWYYDGTTYTEIVSYTVTTAGTELTVSSLTSSGTTATCVTSSSHSLAVGDSVLIAGVTNYTSYNGTFDVASVLGTSSFTYTLSESTGSPAAGTAIKATPQVVRYDFPKTFTHSFYQDRYFVACTTSNPNRVWQSYYNQPTNFTTYDASNPTFAADQYDIGAAGERIVKLFPYNSGLMVFKSKSIYKIIGDATPMQIVEITKELGCNNPNSIIEDNGILYFFGSDGYCYAYDGSVFTRLSQNIENTTRNIPQTNDLFTSWDTETLEEFGAGTTSNTYVMYSGDNADSEHVGKVIPVQTIDDFSDGNINGWTLVSGSTNIVTRTSLVRNSSQTYLTPVGSSISLYKDISPALTNVKGKWYFDFYFGATDMISVSQLIISSSTFSIAYIQYGYLNPIGKTIAVYRRDSAVSPSYTGAGKTLPITQDEYIGEHVYADTYTAISLFNGTTQYTEDSDTTAYPFLNNASRVYLTLSSSNCITNISAPLGSTSTVCEYTSEIKDLGTEYEFGDFEATENLNNQTINYYMRTDVSSTTITGQAWTQIENNTQITLDNNQYVQWKAEFITDDLNELPELEKVSIIYYAKIEDRGNIVRGTVASKFISNKMYTAIPISKVYNNYVITYDLINNSWWKYSGIYPFDFAIKRNILFIADSRYGVILKQTENFRNDYDATTETYVPISAYYYTKQDYFDIPFVKKKLDLLSLAMKRQSTGSLVIDYYVNGYTAHTLTYPQTGIEPTKFYINKYPAIEKGYYFQWKFSNSTINNDFELYSFATNYSLLPYEVTE